MKIQEALFVASLCLTLSFTHNDVRLPPSITKGPPRNMIYRKNDSIKLDCRGSGVPNVTYEWKKNGIKLNQTLRNIQTDADGTIIIEFATSMDDGFYQCFARNEFGTALSDTAHLQMAFLDSTAENVTEVLNKVAREETPFHIPCDSRRSFPKPTYIWEMANGIEDKNPIELQLSNRIQIDENGYLHFAYARPEDNLDGRSYRCTTYNPYLDIKAGGNYTQVTVTRSEIHINYTLPVDGHRGTTNQLKTSNTYPATTTANAPTAAPTRAPNYAITPRGEWVFRRKRSRIGIDGFFSDSPTVAVIGGSVTLRCFYYSSWRSTIYWLGPWNTFPVGRYKLNTFNTSLSIENIIASDEGEYVCIVTGHQRRLLMIVEAAPVFYTKNDGPYDVNVTEGESFTFNCVPEAKPVAKIIWRQDGKELDPNNPPKRFAFSKDDRILTIRDVCRDCVDRESKTDLMVIQCNASNVHGYAFAQGYLNVLRKTRVTVNGERHERHRIAIASSESSQIPVVCRATSDPSTPPTVRLVKVENNDKQQPVPDDLLIITTKDDILTVQINPNSTRQWTTYQVEYRCIGDNGYSNDSQTIDIIVTDKYCETETDEKHSIQWNRTLGGKEIYRPCPGNATGICSRQCFLNVTWSNPNCNGCFDNEFKELLHRLTTVLDTTGPKNQTAVAEIVSQLSVLTNKSERLSPGNLNVSVMMLNLMADFRIGDKDNPTKEEIQSFIQATSNVLQPNNSDAWKEIEKVNESFASIILFSVDVYGRSLSMLNTSNICNSENKANLVVEGRSLKETEWSHEHEFPNCSVWGENRISISTDALSSDQSAVKMWGSYYGNIHDYLPDYKDFGSIGSTVLSFSIDGIKNNKKLKKPVLITLQHNQRTRMSYQRKCAFWNFDRREWDSTGCSVTSTTLTHTICSCDHLSNFAMFMSREASVDWVLSLISIIGCSISVVALILTVLAYALTWKQSKSTQAAVLMNLCVALIIAYVIFLAGADKVNCKMPSLSVALFILMIGCKVVAVLLHYFFLAAFFLMLAEGVELLLYIIFVFHVRRTRETVMLILSAWVLPLIIVAVSVGTRVKEYGDGSVCWLSVDTGLIWAFVGPVLCIITINFVILIVVLIWMSRRRSFIANNDKKRNEIRATLWNLSVTCPVLGLGWLFGVFSLVFGHVVFQYLFIIVNSLQGLFIFIFHAVFHNKKVREKIADVYSNYICGCRRTVYHVTVSVSISDKPGFVPMAVHHKERMETKEQYVVHSSGTQTTSIDDSRTSETPH